MINKIKIVIRHKENKYQKNKNHKKKKILKFQHYFECARIYIIYLFIY